MKRIICLAALIAGLLAPAAEAGLKLVFAPEAWSFSNGPEFAGASGSIAAGPDAIRLEGDFVGGGDYVAVKGTTLDYPAFQEMRLHVRTESERIMLRIRDSAGQTHQFTGGKLSGRADEWQKLAFRLDDRAGRHWGGPNDGVVRAPVREFSLMIRKAWLPEVRGKAEFRDIELAGTAPDAQIPLKLAPPPPDRCFVSPRAAEALRLVLLCGPLQPDPRLGSYEFRDYAGKKIAAGKALFDPADRSYSIPLPPEPGFYELDLPGFGQSHGIVAVDSFQGKPDDYFGIDSPTSRSGMSEEQVRQLMRIYVRSGIVRHRDRIGWGELNPEPGKLDFNARKGRYEMARRLAAEAGLRVQDVTHDTPAWNRRLASGEDAFLAGVNTGRYSYGSNIYPRNLILAAESVSEMARHWPAVEAFEVWNEPDILFGNNFPPEFAAALTKAVSRRYADDRVGTLLMGGCFANPKRERMYRTSLENGLAEDSDVISFHTYTRTDEEEAKVTQMRGDELAVSPARAGIPYWITESGMPWQAAGRPGRNDDIFSAAEIVGKGIEYRALGAAAYFPFKTEWYGESSSNFGMIGRDRTPLRSLAAYTFLPQVLAHKEYIGDLALPGATRCRVFSDNRETVACVYVALDTRANMGKRRDFAPEPLTLPPGMTLRRITGIDGRPLALKEGKLPVADGVVYLWLDKGFKLECDTNAMRLYRLAKAYKATPRAAKPVVIQPDYELTELIYSREGYLVRAGEKMTLKVRFNNLSDQPVTLEPILELPKGAAIAEFPAGPVAAGAGTRDEFIFTVAFTEALPMDRYSVFKLTDRFGNATPMTVAVKRRKSPAELVVGREPGAWIPMTEWYAVAVPKADIDAKFRLSWSPEALRIEVAVDDPEHHGDHGAKEAWRSDSVQVALQLRNGNNNEFREFCASSSGDGAKVYRHEPKKEEGVAEKTELCFTRDKRISLYRIEIPASELGVEKLESGRLVGAAFVVNSGDRAKRNGYLGWGDGIADGKNPALFNLLKLRQ